MSALSEAGDATRGSSVRLGAEVVGRVLALATSFLLMVALGVEGFGVFAALSGVAVILAEAGELGLQGTAARALVAETLGLRAMVRAKVVLSAAAAAIAVCVPLLARLLGPAAVGLAPPSWRGALEASLASADLLAPLILYFAVAGWSEFLGVALRARGRRLEEGAVLLCLRAAALVAVVAVLQAGGGLRGVAWAHLASTLPPLALGAFLARRAYAQAPAGPDRPVGEVLRTSWPLAVNGGLALLSLRLELLLVFGLRGPREAGLFGAALKFVESLNAVPAAITAGAMPALTREGLREGGGVGVGAVRGRTAATVALLAAPGAAGLALLAPGLVALLGPGYEAAAAPLRVLAFAVMALFMNTVQLHALIAVGRAHWLPRLTALRVAAALVLALVLVPRWGAVGAAVGFLTAELLLTALAARACVAARFEVPVTTPLAVALGVSLPMALAVRAFGGGPFVSAALGAVTYAATLLAAWRVAPRRLRRALGAEGVGT
jgi:O-antigen/teichoic acid export membrane protein